MYFLSVVNINYFYVLFVLAADISANQYAMVDFGRECKAVVAFQLNFSKSVDLDAIQCGNMVNNKWEYQTRIILSCMLLGKREF